MKPRDLERPWLAGLLLVAALLLALPAFWCVQRAAVVAMQYPWQLDREEGFLLQQALDLRAGRSIYPSLETYPLTVGNYPPVYPALYAAALAVGEPGLGQGRVLVLLALLAIAGMGAWWVYRETRMASAAALTPLLFLVTWNWNNWAVFTRVDIPAIAFGLAGLLVLGDGRSKRRLLAAGALFVLGVYTKQTQVFAPMAGLAMLLLTGRRREAMGLAGGMAGAGLAILGILQLVTGGEFWRHTVTYNANVMEWGKLGVWAGHLARFSGEKLAVAVVGLAVLWRCRHAAPTALAAGVWLLLNGISYIQLAKAGSAANYLLELDVAVAVVACLACGLPLPESATRWRLVQPCLAAVLLVGAALQWLPLRAVSRHPIPVELPGSQVAWTRLVSAPEPVLSELPIYTIRAGKPVIYQPFIMQQLAAEGRWEQTSFLADLEAGRFPLIVTTQPMDGSAPTPGWTPEMRAVVERRYAPTEAVETWGFALWFYEPRSTP